MEAFVRQAGVIASQLYMVKNAEGRAEGSGYAVFSTHYDAVTALSLTGKILGERLVQVSPATDKSFEAILPTCSAFPVS